MKRIATVALAGTLAMTAIGIGPSQAAGNVTAPRPKAEHVPSTVGKVTIHYSVVARPGRSKTVRLTEGQAAHLIRLFDRLRREPRHTVHCDAIGGPVYLVTFTGAHHTWAARQAICTNVTVTRDRNALPTLLPSSRWDKAIGADLKADA